LLFEHEPFADVAEQEWERSASIRDEIELDEFVVMPNHIHGVVWLRAQGADDLPARDPVGAQGLAPL
jgi:putative transposase